MESVQAEQGTRKGKVRVPVPEVCARCIEKMLLCETETGKPTLCQACKTAKVQCKRPREESQSQR